MPGMVSSRPSTDPLLRFMTPQQRLSHTIYGGEGGAPLPPTDPATLGINATPEDQQAWSLFTQARGNANLRPGQYGSYTPGNPYESGGGYGPGYGGPPPSTAALASVGSNPGGADDSSAAMKGAMLRRLHELEVPTAAPQDMALESYTPTAAPEDTPLLSTGPYTGALSPAEQANLTASKERSGLRLQSGLKDLSSEMGARGITGSGMENASTRGLLGIALGEQQGTEADLLNNRAARIAQIEDENAGITGRNVAARNAWTQGEAGRKTQTEQDNARIMAQNATARAGFQSAEKQRMADLLKYYGMAY